MNSVEEQFDNVTKLWRDSSYVDYERKLHDKMHIRMNLLEEQLDIKTTKMALKEKEKLKNGNYKMKRERRSLESLQGEEMSSSTTTEKVEKKRRRKKMRGLYRPSNNPCKSRSYDKGSNAACTCCHICRNSIAKKHREFMCCSSCHYVYCKSCFTAKLTEWAWDDVKDLTNWVCRVCLGTCRCQRCSVRGPPRWYGHRRSEYAPSPSSLNDDSSPPPSPQEVSTPVADSAPSDDDDDEEDEEDEHIKLLAPPQSAKVEEVSFGMGETTEPIFGDLTNDYYGSTHMTMEDITHNDSNIPPLFPEVLSVYANYPKGKENEKQEKNETTTNEEEELYFEEQFKSDSLRCSCCHTCRASLKTFPRPYKECSTCWCNYCKKCFGSKVKESWESAIRNSAWHCAVCWGVCNCQRCHTRKKLKWYGQLKGK